MAVAGAQEFRTEVAATPLQCFATIVDFESYPTWSSSIRHVAVLERNADGIGRLIEYRIDMKFKSIRYVLAYEYRKPYELTWHSADGDVESIEGAYTFRRVERNRTEAICQQAVSIGFWVPGPVRKLLERTALRQSVLEFKAEVERRIAASATKKKRRA